MTDKTPDQLTSATSAADADLLMIYPSGGPMKKLAFSAFLAQVLGGLGSSLLTVANNLSDVASASAARANLGLGTAATLNSGAVFQVANNGSEVASASSFRSNIGAASASAPTITSGMTFSGAVKSNVQAVAALELDLSTAEFFTKAISSNATFTFANATASKGLAFVLELTISSAAVPTWPASVQWAGGLDPSSSLGNGEHVIGFLSFDGGVSWHANVVSKASAVPA